MCHVRREVIHVHHVRRVEFGRRRRASSERVVPVVMLPFVSVIHVSRSLDVWISVAWKDLHACCVLEIIFPG